ncbi:hypothetical protein [Chryseobacterium indologenes]|nr:hypothetical protein [Chryseobacterium indologenes]
MDDSAKIKGNMDSIINKESRKVPAKILISQVIVQLGLDTNTGNPFLTSFCICSSYGKFPRKFNLGEAGSSF